MILIIITVVGISYKLNKERKKRIKRKKKQLENKMIEMMDIE